MAGIYGGPDLDIGKKVIQDAVSAYKAQPNVAGGLGAATREVLTGPVSYAMTRAADLTSPVLETAGNFARGLIGNALGTSTRRGPATRPAPTPRAPLPQAGAIDRAMTAPAPVAPAPGISVTPAPVSNVNPAAYAPTQYSPTPSLAPIPVDPNAEIMAALNNGTWSGMMNSKVMARRLDADRTAATAAANAQSSRLGSLASMKNADSVAQRTVNDSALTGEQIKESQQRQRGQEITLADAQETEKLRRLATQGDEKALAKYRSIMAAKLGKDPDAPINERLLEAYLRSNAEHLKAASTATLGGAKDFPAAPSFQEFLRTLPPGMFPNVQRAMAPTAPPPGATKVGTSGGRPVYQLKDGSQVIATQ